MRMNFWWSNNAHTNPLLIQLTCPLKLWKKLKYAKNWKKNLGSRAIIRSMKEETSLKWIKTLSDIDIGPSQIGT